MYICSTIPALCHLYGVRCNVDSFEKHCMLGSFHSPSLCMYMHGRDMYMHMGVTCTCL